MGSKRYEELNKRKKEEYDRVYAEICRRWDCIAKPLGSLGKFEDMVARIGAVQESADVDISKRAVIIMCADNGIVEEGVSQSGQEVTREVASWMGQGKSSVCHFAHAAGADTFPVDIGINMDGTPEGVMDRKILRGTNNFLNGPAMSIEECMRAIQTGIDIVKDLSLKKGYTLIATGEMGIGNTTTSSALAAALLGMDPDELTGRGAGLSDEGLSRKKQVIKLGLKKHGACTDGNVKAANGLDICSTDYALDMLRRLGGLDIAGLAGVFLGGAACHVPVIIDGFISAVAALAAERMSPGTKECMLASHMGREPGMKYLLKELGLDPVIDGDLALGEGTGAVMLMPMLDAAVELYNKAMFFEETGVEQYERFDENEKVDAQ